MNSIITVIRWIVKLPIFWMPASWKGYRRVIITAILAVCIFLQGLDLVNFADSICALVNQVFNATCDLRGVASGILLYVGMLYEALKDEAEASIYNPKGLRG